MLKEFFKRIVITFILLIVCVTIIAYIFEIYSVDVELFYLYFYFTKCYFIIVCFVVLHKYNIKTLTVGLFLTSIALFYDILFLHGLIPHIQIVFYILHKGFNLLGMMLIIYGLWNILVKNKILMIKLKDLAFYDPITKLPNRNYLLKHCPIKQHIVCDHKNCETCDLYKHDFIKNNHEKAFLFVDIDDFKYINDNLGHANGDFLLKSIADRLKNCVSKEGTLIHLSGDEFLIILNQNETNEETIQNLISTINQPFNVSDIDIHITCSIGVSYYPIHGRTIDELIQKADIAMYEAKKEGKNNFFVYSDRIERSFNKRFELINDIIHAITQEEFIVYYQAKANVMTGSITGFEALARWDHPEKGIIYPIDFIPLAEDTGLIKQIDSLILKKVCRQISKWMTEGKTPYNISVNISPLFFMDKHFISTIDKIISENKIDPNYISIEVTENISLRDCFQTKRILNELKKRNIKVLLDDFGRGYSSFRYINEFTVDYIKIDKAFIDRISHDQVSQTLVKAIVSLSSQLNFKVIPEGVETPEQLNTLKELGCHEFQGYYLNKPQPIEEIDLKF